MLFRSTAFAIKRERSASGIHVLTAASGLPLSAGRAVQRRNCREAGIVIGVTGMGGDVTADGQLAVHDRRVTAAARIRKVRALRHIRRTAACDTDGAAKSCDDSRIAVVRMIHARFRHRAADRVVRSRSRCGLCRDVAEAVRSAARVTEIIDRAV